MRTQLFHLSSIKLSVQPRLRHVVTGSLLVVAAVLGGCSTTQPNRYEGLASSRDMRPNTEDKSGHVPYRIGTPVHWERYRSLMIEPVVVYDGRDNQFDDIEPKEKQALADHMLVQFNEQLGKRFRLVREPQPDTLRLRLTLTGAKANTAVLSTVTRFDLAGGPYNAVQGVRGKEGAFMGSVMYSVELYDATSGELLDAFVTKQFPNAMNVSATVGRMAAARVGVEKGAEELAAQFK